MISKTKKKVESIIFSNHDNQKDIEIVLSRTLRDNLIVNQEVVIQGYLELLFNCLCSLTTFLSSSRGQDWRCRYFN